MVVSLVGAGAPDRTIAQRLSALERANEIRTWRAARKRDLKAGRLRVTDLLLEPPPLLESMKVRDLMLAVPKIGRGKADKMLRVLGVSPSKTVGGLTDRQRMALVAALLPYAVSVRRVGTMET